MKVKNDHRSKFPNLNKWKEEAWKKKQGFTGFQPVTSAITVRHARDLHDTAPVLLKLELSWRHIVYN